MFVWSPWSVYVDTVFCWFATNSLMNAAFGGGRRLWLWHSETLLAGPSRKTLNLQWKNPDSPTAKRGLMPASQVKTGNLSYIRIFTLWICSFETVSERQNSSTGAKHWAEQVDFASQTETKYWTKEVKFALQTKRNTGPKKWIFNSNKSSSHRALSVNNYSPWQIRMMKYPARQLDMTSVKLAMFKKKTQIPTDESHNSVIHSFRTMWRQQRIARNCERSYQVIITSTPHKQRCVHSQNTGSLTLRRLMSYIYGAPILDVSRSHTTTHHSR